MFTIIVELPTRTKANMRRPSPISIRPLRLTQDILEPGSTGEWLITSIKSMTDPWKMLIKHKN
jgi:hypothetical protein